MPTAAGGKLAAAGLILIALAVASCSSPNPGSPRVARTAPVPGQTLVVDTTPGYSSYQNETPTSIVRYAYRHAAACGTARAETGGSPSANLILKAKSTYVAGVIEVRQIAAAFHVGRATLADPFMIFWLSSDSSAPQDSEARWATSMVAGNYVAGYHATGWMRLSVSTPVTGQPSLHLQLWTLRVSGPSQNTYYCVSSTDLRLTGHDH